MWCIRWHVFVLAGTYLYFGLVRDYFIFLETATLLQINLTVYLYCTSVILVHLAQSEVRNFVCLKGRSHSYGIIFHHGSRGNAQ